MSLLLHIHNSTSVESVGVGSGWDLAPLDLPSHTTIIPSAGIATSYQTLTHDCHIPIVMSQKGTDEKGKRKEEKASAWSPTSHCYWLDFEHFMTLDKAKVVFIYFNSITYK